MMKVLLALLIILEVVFANTLRGSEGNRELLPSTSSTKGSSKSHYGGGGYRSGGGHPYRFIGHKNYGYGGYRRSRGSCKPDLYLVEEDFARKTKRCTDDLRDEFWKDANSVRTQRSDRGARYSDLVYYVDENTDCYLLSLDIDEDIRRHRGRTGCNRSGGFYGRGYWYGGHRVRSRGGGGGSKSSSKDNDSTSSKDKDDDSTSSKDNDD
ncbi:predicted protein [Thalassiosira pseudonana CCMP1335]|uniref:Uncharacterized protein n=1 Tax=Thalassiosira pseudonana TaxID=35128 RepID=B8CBZ6_THAPS|nr:predicted protein [Thalassiosira pseudonana CCMP1335]EED88867.1 predicted protein [Thalassiosira pseudonana CCMP1335]|eukprot:g10963.t1 g10963   contig46:101868-102666(-)